jgi:hypothetical protein
VITLNNASVPANAPQGWVIGAFAISGGPPNAKVNLQSQNTPATYFLVSNNNLLVAWAGEAVPGSYQIQVHAPGAAPQTFSIDVTQPLIVTLSEGPVTAYDASELMVAVAASAPQGTIIMPPPVRSDSSGNVIAGTTFKYTLGSSGYFVANADSSLATAWTSPATTGSYPIVITATSPDGTTETATLTVQIQ